MGVQMERLRGPQPTEKPQALAHFNGEQQSLCFLLGVGQCGHNHWWQSAQEQSDGRKLLSPLLVPMSCENGGYLRVGLPGTPSLVWVQWAIVGDSLARHQGVLRLLLWRRVRRYVGKWGKGQQGPQGRG